MNKTEDWEMETEIDLWPDDRKRELMGNKGIGFHDFWKPHIRSLLQAQKDEILERLTLEKKISSYDWTNQPQKDGLITYGFNLAIDQLEALKDEIRRMK